MQDVLRRVISLQESGQTVPQELLDELTVKHNRVDRARRVYRDRYSEYRPHMHRGNWSPPGFLHAEERRRNLEISGTDLDQLVATDRPAEPATHGVRRFFSNSTGIDNYFTWGTQSASTLLDGLTFVDTVNTTGT